MKKSLLKAILSAVSQTGQDDAFECRIWSKYQKKQREENRNVRAMKGGEEGEGLFDSVLLSGTQYCCIL